MSFTRKEGRSATALLSEYRLFRSLSEPGPSFRQSISFSLRRNKAMKRVLVPFLALATLSFLGSSAYAQGGRPAGAGKPSGVGGGPGSGAGASATHGNMSGADSSTARPSSPGSVLSRNSSLSGALTKALGKSGITVTDLASTCSLQDSGPVHCGSSHQPQIPWLYSHRSFGREEPRRGHSGMQPAGRRQD